MAIRIKKAKRSIGKKLFFILPLLMCLSGLYLLVLVLTPVYYPPPEPLKGWNEPVPEKAEITEQRVYIPRLSLNLKFDDTENALNNGLWHRYPNRGDPEKGGNFILAGHRFELAPTPSETRRKSPLYHIDKLEVGDYLYSDFNGKRYLYEITKKFNVKPTQVEIEAPSEDAKLTLYTCTLGGENDGRNVVEAKLSKTDVDPNIDLKVNAAADQS
jgi:sortase A